MNDFIIPENPGGLPHIRDPRDLPYELYKQVAGAVAGERPAQYFANISQLHKANQFFIGSCVGQATDKAKEYGELQEGDLVDLSARYIYAHCKRIDGYPGQGTYLATALKVLSERGTCLDSQFPNSAVSQDHEKYIDLSLADPNADETAKEARISGYAFVSTSWDSICDALWRQGVVVLCSAGTNVGWREQPLRPPQPGEPVWYHCYMAFGYDENFIYFRNSWGEYWGLPMPYDGCGKFAPNYIQHLSAAATIVDMSDELRKWLQQLPSPTPIEKSIAQVQSVFGSTWRPAPKVEQYAFREGKVAYVKVLGSKKPYQVYSLGYGGYKETAWSFLKTFKTLNQEGIVGDIQPWQARALGILDDDAQPA